MDKLKKKKSGLGIVCFIAMVLSFSNLPIISGLMPIFAFGVGIRGLLKFKQLGMVDKIFLILSWLLILLVIYVVIKPPFGR